MTFASDVFTGSDGTTAVAHDAKWIKHASWSASESTIQSNRLTGTGSVSTAYSYNETPASADYEVSSTLYIADTNTSHNAGCMARVRTDTATGYMCRYRRGTGVQLFKYVSGTSGTQLGSTVSGDVTAGSTVTLKLQCNGSTIKVFKDGAEVISVTDTSITLAGFAGLWISGNGASTGVHVDEWSAAALAGDTTAPVLTSPTGTTTGATTATVGATTDEGNGTLYVFVSTSATPPASATLKAGTGAAWAGSVAVSSTGAKTFSATGLTASTGYYAHLIQTDAATNDSNIVTSAQFTTSAPATPPSITSQPSNNTIKRGQTATFTIAATGATSYQWEKDAGSGYADISAATSASYTTPATVMADDADLFRCKATNADGTTTSSAATLTVQQCVLALNAAGYEFGDGNDPATMAVLASTELQVAAYPLAEWPPVSAVATATATTASTGRMADLGDNDLVFGATYRVIARNAADGQTWAWTMTAS